MKLFCNLFALTVLLSLTLEIGFDVFTYKELSSSIKMEKEDIYDSEESNEDQKEENEKKEGLDEDKIFHPLSMNSTSVLDNYYKNTSSWMYNALVNNLYNFVIYSPPELFKN